jgi:hypothetical protein
MCDRRQFLGLLGTAGAALAIPSIAQAGVARGISLAELVRHSTRVVRGLPLDAYAVWETIGDQRHITTYTRLRSDELVWGAAPESSEILVRTLGGTVGRVGEIVHGEAVIAQSQACLLFLLTNAGGFDEVTAMAEGHYPLITDGKGTVHLSPSPNLPALAGSNAAQSAVRRLVGQRLDDARLMIRGAQP